MPLRFLIYSIYIVLISCNNHSSGHEKKKTSQSEMEQMNRYLLQKDRERIQSYAERKGLELTESPTGLWYQIITPGEGDVLTDNSRILMEYECSLLDGTECYSSKDLGPMKLVLGKSSVEAGLNEGLRLLKPGAEAVFILPPYLAFGLPGDGKKIPPRSIIVYNVIIKGTK